MKLFVIELYDTGRWVPWVLYKGGENQAKKFSRNWVSSQVRRVKSPEERDSLSLRDLRMIGGNLEPFDWE